MMYETVKLTTKPTKISNTFTKSLRVVHGTLPHAVPSPAWGVDPGVNFGLTVIEGRKVYVFNGSLLSDPTPGRQGLVAYKFMRHMIETFHHHDPILVIEGAAYGAPFRQVELSEIRTGFYLAAALNTMFKDVVIKPPATIRKAVFDNGKTQAGDEWPVLNHNAADALSIALYAAQYTEA